MTRLFIKPLNGDVVSTFVPSLFYDIRECIKNSTLSFGFSHWFALLSQNKCVDYTKKKLCFPKIVTGDSRQKILNKE